MHRMLDYLFKCRGVTSASGVTDAFGTSLCWRGHVQILAARLLLFLVRPDVSLPSRPLSFSFLFF